MLDYKIIKKEDFYSAQYLHHIATGETEEQAILNLKEKLKLRGIKINEKGNE